MGPLINASRLTEIEGIVAEAVRAGAKVVAGGGRASAFNAGHFFEPTVLTDVTDGMKVMAEENFGPIAAITRVCVGSIPSACSHTTPKAAISASADLPAPDPSANVDFTRDLTIAFPIGFFVGD